jgi:hypothetical protein
MGDAIAVRFPDADVHLFVDGRRVAMAEAPVAVTA